MIDLPMYDPMDWQADALCFRMGVDPNVMQPERATREEVEDAKRLCAGCPVLDACRAHAEGQNAQYAEGQELGAYGVHAAAWFGRDPVWEVERECVCGKRFRTADRGAVSRRFCSDVCRKRANRAQKVSA